jgi:hypothetical protein
MSHSVALARTDVSDEYRLHHQDGHNQQARNFSSNYQLRRYVLPKRRFLQESHGVTSQKTALFIATGAKASNLTHNRGMFSGRSDIQWTGTDEAVLSMRSVLSLYNRGAAAITRGLNLEIVQWRRVRGWREMAASLRSGEWVQSWVESWDERQNGRMFVVNVKMGAEDSGEETGYWEYSVRAAVK